MRKVNLFAQPLHQYIKECTLISGMLLSNLFHIKVINNDDIEEKSLINICNCWLIQKIFKIILGPSQLAHDQNIVPLEI